MAVVKADAYGLGIEKVTEFLSDKVDAFAVINMEEALKVKSEKDVLILTPELSREDIELIKDNFIITIDNEELLKKITSIIPEKEVRAHIYVDTGMNRFGVKPVDFYSFLQTVENYKNIKVEGVYTHLNNTEDNYHQQPSGKKPITDALVGFCETVEIICNFLKDRLRQSILFSYTYKHLKSRKLLLSP